MSGGQGGPREGILAKQDMHLTRGVVLSPEAPCASSRAGSPASVVPLYHSL